MEVCGCYLGKRQIGTVHWRRERQQLTVQVRCPFEEGFIYRVLLDTGTDMVPLGVMLPRRGQFMLEKQLYLPVTPVNAHIDRTLPGEGHLPGLPLAWSAFSQAENGLLRGSWRDVELLLFAMDTGAQCPWAHLLCLASILEHDGRQYAVLCTKGDRYAPLSDMLRSGDMIW